MGQNELAIWNMVSTCFYSCLIFFYREFKFSLFFPISYIELLAYSIFVSFKMGTDCGTLYYVIAVIPSLYLFNIGTKRKFHNLFLCEIVSSFAALGIVALNCLHFDYVHNFYADYHFFRLDFYKIHSMWALLSAALFLTYLSICIFSELRTTSRKNKIAEDNLNFEKNHDILTKILNRRCINSLVKESEADKMLNMTNYAVSIFDIDHFKDVNDTYGHLIGDEVLIKISELCQEEINKFENIEFARWGGEEFLILFKNISEKDIAEKSLSKFLTGLRKKIEETPFICGDIKINLTLTFGISYSTETGKSEKLINLADQRLMHGKQSGRNRVVDSGEFYIMKKDVLR